MEVLGYFAAVFVGISLGLIGGGGSILTMPLMVYFFGLNPILATSYSLFIVGSTSLVGAINNYNKELISIKTALLFGSVSIITVFFTRKFLVPLIPGFIIYVGNFKITESLLFMVLFAAVMLLASTKMILDKRKDCQQEEVTKTSFEKLAVYGFGIGILTGFLGVGGGFLLIPSLVLLVKLPIKKAVGTSLLIIALNSLIGFTGDLGQVSIDWWFLLRITTIASVGIFLGSAIGKKISGDKLKKGFGWFILMMGIYIILKETLLS